MTSSADLLPLKQNYLYYKETNTEGTAAEGSMSFRRQTVSQARNRLKSWVTRV